MLDLRSRRHGKGGERGLTLVELMIALGILALVMASLLAVFDAILQMSRASSNLMIATLDAQMVMEEVSDIEYDDILTYVPPTLTNIRDENVDVQITMEGGAPIVGPLPEIVRIVVEVTWTERGSPVKTRLTTLRTRGL